VYGPSKGQQNRGEQHTASCRPRRITSGTRQASGAAAQPLTGTSAAAAAGEPFTASRQTT